MKNKILKFCTFIIIWLLSINIFSCEASRVVNNQELNPHIVFSSRRWWNYDIFITDVSGVNKTQITKNRWIDLTQLFHQMLKILHLFQIEMKSRNLHFRHSLAGWLQSMESF